jgi:hypothetical protein
MYPGDLNRSLSSFPSLLGFRLNPNDGAVVVGARRRRHRAGNLNFSQNHIFFSLISLLNPLKSVSRPKNFKSLTKLPDRRQESSGKKISLGLFFYSVSWSPILVWFFVLLFFVFSFVLSSSILFGGRGGCWNNLQKM